MNAQRRIILLYSVLGLSLLLTLLVLGSQTNAQGNLAPLQASPTSISNGWKIGDQVGLRPGTLIRVGNGINYPINACVPNVYDVPEGWLVQITDGPRYTDGYVWWGVSRYLVDHQPWSGSGWTAPDILPVPCSTITPPSVVDKIPPDITGVHYLQDGKGGLLIYATITDNVQVAFASVFTETAEFPMIKMAGNQYRVLLSGQKRNATIRFKVSAIDTSGNKAFYPTTGTIPVTIRYSALNGLQPRTTSVMEPITLPMGNFVTRHVDLQVPAPGIPFEFARTYNAQADDDGPFGIGWTHSYNWHLEVANDPLQNWVIVTYPDGHTAQFMQSGDAFSPPAGTADKLTQTDTGFVLTIPEQISYSFNTDGQLVEVRDRNSNTVTLTYSGQNLTRIVDSAARNYVLTYAGKHIISLRDPINRLISYEYGGGLLTKVHLTGGRDLTYNYNGQSRMLGITDPNGRVFVSNTYDNQDRVVEQRDAAGSVARFSYAADDSQAILMDNENNSATYQFDANFLLVKEIDALGHATSYAYDGNYNRISVLDRNGHTTAFSYDAFNNMISRLDSLSGLTTWSFQNGRDLMVFHDATGAEIHFNRDALGNATSITTPLGTTNYSYNHCGLPVSITDARHNSTTLTYDAKCNLASVTDAEIHTTTFGFDLVGRLRSIIDANQHASQFIYDEADRLISTIDAQGATHLAYDGVGNLLSIQDRMGASTSFAYTVNDQVGTITDPLGFSSRMTYDRMYHRTSITDRRGNTQKFVYDAVYDLVRFQDETNQITNYEYDANQQLIAVVNALGVRTALTHDELGRISQVTDGLAQVSTFGYDAVGRLQTLHDARGGITRYTYNGVGELTTITDALGGVRRYSFDANGNLIQVLDATNAPTSYEYDKANRLVRVIDALQQSQLLAYDPVGNVVQFTDKRGNITHFSYNATDDLIQIVDARQGVTRYDLDLQSRITGLTNPNAHKTRFVYNRRGELTDITYIDTLEGFLYLAGVLDVFSRRVVGCGPWLSTCVRTWLKMRCAWLSQRQPGRDLLHHSDQGSQYTSDDYLALLTRHGITLSMSHNGDCYDNAIMESLWATLKAECATAPFLTRVAARLAIFDYLEVWYNRQRLHSALDYTSPAHFERLHALPFP